MSIPILVTKLFIPATRPELVPRPRLIERLDGGLHRKLTLISAPAGFGKTTLVTEWLDRLRGDSKQGNQNGNGITWLSLDEGDNDPVRFLTYFIAALNQIEGIDTMGVMSMLQSPQPPPIEAVLTPLINEIAAISDRILFVLDDYHLIDAQSIQEIISFLLENIPPQLHLVITTREDPLLPLPRLRSRGQLTEMRATDLRFTSSEATKFLNQIMGLDLSTEDIAALETRTEGWIAGLQLAALALQGAISLQGKADTSRLIQSFTGSNRLVLDYLIEEVLNQQPEDIQNFLLQTAILDRLTGSLCDSVTGQDNGQFTLESLDRANLFIVPLDGQREWYRYHHLFADLLRLRLHQTQLDREAILHTQASKWYEQNGFADDAIDHALQANDFERSAALITDLADPLWEQGEHVKLRRWLEKLPEEWLCTNPQLCIYHAWFLYSTGHQEAAERYLQAAGQSLASTIKRGPEKATLQTESPSNPNSIKLQGRLSAIRAMIASWWEDTPAIIQHASLALEYLPKKDPWRGMAAVALGDAFFYSGDMKAAYQTRLDTLESCQAEDDLFFFMIANLKVATSLREMGQLEQTIEICQEQLEFAKQNGLSQTIFVGWAIGLLGIALAEQNELEKALGFVTKSLELTKGGDLTFVGFSHMVLARVQFYSRDLSGAEATLKNLANIAQKHYLPHYITGPMAAWQARIWLAQNRLDTAFQFIDERSSNADRKITLMYDDVIVVLARYHLAQGKLAEAAELMARLLKIAEAGEYAARIIELSILQALTYQARDDMTQAINTLKRAITLAEPGGYIRVFVDEGPPMARLLYEVLPLGIAPAYVQQLLEAFPDIEQEQPEPSKSQIPESEWIEPLSERELEVLQLIGEGLTNQEIASRLYLSLNTVKAHTRTIYSKLGVNSRTQAVARAMTLGIIIK